MNMLKRNNEVLHGYEAQPAVQGKLRNAAKIMFLQAKVDVKTN